MSLTPIFREILHGAGQDFTTEKFPIVDILNQVRRQTGISNAAIRSVMPRVVEEFCKKTWILQKQIELGDEFTETQSYSEVLEDAQYDEILTDDDYNATLVD